MAGWVQLELFLEEEGPVIEEEAVAAEEAVVAEAEVLAPKVEAAAEAIVEEAETLAEEAEAEGEAILNKIEEALGDGEVDEVAAQCEGEGQPAASELAAEGTGSAPKGVPEPKVTDPKLQNLVKDLYKGAKTEKPIGTGSTADAIRHETATGEPVGGKFHTQKGQEYARALQKWLAKNPDASPTDRTAAQQILEDLGSALGGK